MAEHASYMRNEPWRQTGHVVSMLYNVWRGKGAAKQPHDFFPEVFRNVKSYQPDVSEEELHNRVNRALNRMYKVFPKQSLN